MTPTSNLKTHDSMFIPVRSLLIRTPNSHEHKRSESRWNFVVNATETVLYARMIAISS